MSRQRGFTLIEVLAASAATGVVMVAGTAFLMKALSWNEELSAKIDMNRHARETYDMLAYGGRANTVGKDGTSNVYSVRGMKNAPPGGLRNKSGLSYPSNKLTLTPDLFTPTTITCTAPQTPVPDCGPGGPGPGSVQTVQGWLGSDIQIQGGPKGVNNLTVNVAFVITDPFEAQRAISPLLFSDTYRTIFTLVRDEDDPH